MAEYTNTFYANGSSSTSVELSSSWVFYQSASTSSGAELTCSNFPEADYQDVTFDLTSIPADYGITSAILTFSTSSWTSGSYYKPTRTFGKYTATVYAGAQNEQYGQPMTQERFILTMRLIPGQINTVRFYFHPSVESPYICTRSNSTYATYGWGSCAAYLTISNIQLTVIYTEVSSNPPLVLIGRNSFNSSLSDWFIGIDGVARKITEAYIGINNLARKFYPGLNASYLQPGDILLIDELGNSNFVEWIVMGQGHYTEDTVAIMRKPLITTGKYSSSATSSSVYYVNQTLDTYLNSTWRQECQEAFQTAMVQTTINCQPYKGSSADVQIARYAWAPSIVEILPTTSVDSSSVHSEGTQFEYFTLATSAGDRIAYKEDGTAWMWFSRSLATGTSGIVYGITASGNRTNTNSTPSGSSNYGGYRPVICISKNATIQKNSDANYTLLL